MAAPEATITSYGCVNPAPVISYTIVNAFTLPGYVVKVHTTAGQMTGTTAVTDVPDGVTSKSCVPATMQQFAALLGQVTETAQAGMFIGVQAFIPGQEYYLMLGATVAVSIGDLLAPSATAGVVCPRNATGVQAACVVFMKALEAKGAQAGATAGTVIKCRATSPMYLAAGVTPT